MKKRFEQLTSRETDIMKVIWESKEPLLASRVAAISDLSTNTVNAVIKNLLNGGMIEVADIVHSGTVLSRRYSPTIAQGEYFIRIFAKQVKDLKEPFLITKLVETLLEQQEDEGAMIAELKSFLENYQSKQQSSD